MSLAPRRSGPQPAREMRFRKSVFLVADLPVVYAFHQILDNINKVMPPGTFPFTTWRHEHRLDSQPGGTRMTDTVDYEIPWYLGGRLIEATVFQALFAWMFAVRHRRTRDYFLQRQGPSTKTSANVNEPQFLDCSGPAFTHPVTEITKGLVTLPGKLQFIRLESFIVVHCCSSLFIVSCASCGTFLSRAAFIMPRNRRMAVAWTSTATCLASSRSRTGKHGW